MALKPMYAEAELADGRKFKERILVADKLRFEHTARTHGWTEESHPVTTNLLLVWSAFKRAGHTQSTFEAFRDGEIVDFLLHNEQDGPDASEDPTSES